MADNTEGSSPPPGQSGSSAAPPSAPIFESAVPRKSFGRRHWGKLTVAVILGVPLLGLLFWTVIGLNYTYSTGERAGYVQKISRKGWLCKTWEGTLYTDIARGFRSDSFNFTVRDDSLAVELEKLSGKRVAVHYDQHTLVPTSCFGDTEYFVSEVRAIPDDSGVTR